MKPLKAIEGISFSLNPKGPGLEYASPLPPKTGSGTSIIKCQNDHLFS